MSSSNGTVNVQSAELTGGAKKKMPKTRRLVLCGRERILKREGSGYKVIINGKERSLTEAREMDAKYKAEKKAAKEKEAAAKKAKKSAKAKKTSKK